MERSIADESLLRRVFSEYLEMPGLRLNCPQAQRLLGLDEHTCSRLLDELVTLKFLVRRPTGAYTRREAGRVPSSLLRMKQTDRNARTPLPATGVDEQHA